MVELEHAQPENRAQIQYVCVLVTLPNPVGLSRKVLTVRSYVEIREGYYWSLSVTGWHHII
jgi:hypothetical protein